MPIVSICSASYILWTNWAHASAKVMVVAPNVLNGERGRRCGVFIGSQESTAIVNMKR
jgi:hypothetical protein